MSKAKDFLRKYLLIFILLLTVIMVVFFVSTIRFMPQTGEVAKQRSNLPAETSLSSSILSDGTYIVYDNILWWVPENPIYDENFKTFSTPKKLLDGVLEINDNVLTKLDSTKIKIENHNTLINLSYDLNTKYSVEEYTSDGTYYLTNNGELYEINHNVKFDILSEVKDFAFFGLGFAIKNDGSLWQFSNNENKDKPIHLMDDVKSVATYWDDSAVFVGVIKNDNSFWLANFGYADDLDNSAVKLKKIHNSVQSFYLTGYYYILYLTTDKNLIIFDGYNRKDKLISKNVLSCYNSEYLRIPYYINNNNELISINFEDAYTKKSKEKHKIILEQAKDNYIAIYMKKCINNAISFGQLNPVESFVNTTDNRRWSLEDQAYFKSNITKQTEDGFFLKQDGTIWFQQTIWNEESSTQIKNDIQFILPPLATSL